MNIIIRRDIIYGASILFAHLPPNKTILQIQVCLFVYKNNNNNWIQQGITFLNNYHAIKYIINED